jgi:hypothetical protein
MPTKSSGTRQPATDFVLQNLVSLKINNGQPTTKRERRPGGNRSAFLVHGVEETYLDFGLASGCVLALCFLL